MRKLLLIVVLAMLGASVAMGASSDQGRRLAGPFCVSVHTGVVRAIAVTQKCKVGELRKVGVAIPITNGTKGPAGPAGLQGAKGDTGPAGPGREQRRDTGATGATGAAGAAGENGCDRD